MQGGLTARCWCRCYTHAELHDAIQNKKAQAPHCCLTVDSGNPNPCSTVTALSCSVIPAQTARPTSPLTCYHAGMGRSSGERGRWRSSRRISPRIGRSYTRRTVNLQSYPTPLPTPRRAIQTRYQHRTPCPPLARVAATLSLLTRAADPTLSPPMYRWAMKYLSPWSQRNPMKIRTQEPRMPHHKGTPRTNKGGTLQRRHQHQQQLQQQRNLQLRRMTRMTPKPTSMPRPNSI